jgi:hypothetical protein
MPSLPHLGAAPRWRASSWANLTESERALPMHHARCYRLPPSPETGGTTCGGSGARSGREQLQQIFDKHRKSPQVSL